MGSRTISSISTVAVGGCALLGCRGARIGRSSPTSAVDAVGAIVGGSYNVLLGTSPVPPTPALAESVGAAATSHDSPSPGSPSSCALPPGEVGLVAGGSFTGGAAGSATAGCSTMGAIGSAPLVSARHGELLAPLLATHHQQLPARGALSTLHFKKETIRQETKRCAKEIS